MKLALLAIFLALPLAAQTAKGIQLTPEEAKEAQALYAEQKSVELRMADLHQKIVTKYNLGNQNTLFPAFDFEYSTDFKYIVPKLPSINTNNFCCPYNSIISTVVGCGSMTPVTPVTMVGSNDNYPFV